MLDKLRTEIDEIDNQIIELIARRFEVTKQVGEHKREQNIPTLDAGREKLIYEKLEQKALANDLDGEFIKELWQVMITQSKKEQNEL